MNLNNDLQAELIATAQRVLTQNYRQQPIVLRRGSGCKVWDVRGDLYLDLTGGIAACPLGHAHLGLAVAITEQAMKLVHVSNLCFVEEQIRCAETLVRLNPQLDKARIFFCNSGAEANEAAIKLAKRYQTIVRGRPERTTVISFEGSFHGRSIATVALTGQEKYRTGFGPLVEWAAIVPWPESSDDKRALERIDQSTCAVILEPIQAEGGIRVPPPGFLAALRKRCDETGTVLIFDEVQTGVGRTGTMFGYESTGIRPDIMSLAKGLGGGVPIGAIVATGEVAQGFAPATHASTFGGNPLATAAARFVLETIENEKLLDRVRTLGEHLGRRLQELVVRFPKIAVEARGQGLLRGLLLNRDAVPIVAKLRERKVLLSVAGGTVVRFVPPFIVEVAELDAGVDALAQVLAEVG